jgi:tetratricopeptide (TPR) repeat protein
MSFSAPAARRVAAFFLVLSLIVAAALADSRASDSAESDEHQSETLAEKTLKEIVARQKDLFAKAEKDKASGQFDEAMFRGEAQSLASSYDVLCQKNPTFAPAFVAYGVFLGTVDMTKAAVAMLLQANKLDPNIALVKNQLAVHLAEDGKPLDALPYVLAAIQLEPKEPLYHVQLGQLLMEARDDFIKSGQFTAAALDKAMIEAFQRAAELAPNDLALAYQHAKAYYAIDPPRWQEALDAWTRLEERPVTTTMRQLVRLQRANVLIKLDRRDDARAVLARVTDPKLAKEKQTLLDQLEPKAEKKDSSQPTVDTKEH